MNPRKAGCILVAFLIAFLPLALAQGTYTQIDVPGAAATFLFGIDSAGDVVGYYVDSNATPHGFLLSGGTYTTIDYPGASTSQANAINDFGKIVGAYFNGSGSAGFIYDIQTQSFTNLVFPDSSGLAPTGVNNAGTIVGLIFFNQNGQPPNVGFELAGGHYRKVPPQNFAYSYVRGISNLGVAVGGTSKDGLHPIDFLFAHDQFRRLNINATFAAPQAINTAGTIVGEYSPAGHFQVGFLFSGGTFTRLVFPGSIQTAATGINDAGVVAGYFTDSSSVSHGFLWAPPGDAATK